MQFGRCTFVGTAVEGEGWGVGSIEIVQVRQREDKQLPLSDPSVRYEVNQAVAKEQLAREFQARVDALLANAKVEGL